MGVADDGHDESVGDRDGQSEVDPLADPYRSPVGSRVHFGELDEGLRGSREDEVGHAQRSARGYELGSQGEEPGHVNRHGHGELWNRGGGERQALGDHPAHASQRPRTFFVVASDHWRHKGNRGSGRRRARRHGRGCEDGGAGAAVGRGRERRWTSLSVIRPSGPVPTIVRGSIPELAASRLARGLIRMRPSRLEAAGAGPRRQGRPRQAPPKPPASGSRPQPLRRDRWPMPTAPHPAPPRPPHPRTRPRC